MSEFWRRLRACGDPEGFSPAFQQVQHDYAEPLRWNQFFDHFLKGAPKPEWMEKGVPFIDREDEKDRFKSAAAQ